MKIGTTCECGCGKDLEYYQDENTTNFSSCQHCGQSIHDDCLERHEEECDLNPANILDEEEPDEEEEFEEEEDEEDEEDEDEEDEEEQ